MTKRQLYLGPLTDNRRWDHIRLRPDDVIVSTPPKSGTTWMQTILALLLSGDPEVEPDLSTRMPWVDNRMRDLGELAERLEAMTHRRSLKSHTPLDGLPIDTDVRYICVFRHPLDTHFSFRNHARNIPLPLFDLWYPEEDEDGTAFRWFLEGGPEGFDTDAAPLAHILRHYEAARAVADRSNVMLVHFADLKRDLKGWFGRVSEFIGEAHGEAVMDRLVQAAGFDHMKQNAARYAPGGGQDFFKSDTAFFDTGGLGKWQGVLSAAELAAYDAAMDAQLTKEERAWLEHGSGD